MCRCRAGIEGAPLDEPARAALAVITRQRNQLVRLVDDLLEATRITSGKIALKREAVIVQHVVDAAVASVSPAIHAAQHTLDVVTPDEPLWVDADRDRISQVIGNLLTNAAKYTPRRGTITVKIGQENDQAVVRVIDNGMGITGEQLPRLFEMFVQANPPDMVQGGLGVGLTIAKRLVELHDGSIEAHSAGPGCGAEFVVRLPLAATPKATQAGPPQPASLSSRRLKVLVVDDNSDLVHMLELAVSAALSYRPDVILLDLGLPVVSGLEVARELRRHPEMAKTRLIALTGWGQEENHRHTSEAGFDHHLTKPTEPDELEALLSKLASSG